jgi:hypothetical protein
MHPHSTTPVSRPFLHHRFSGFVALVLAGIALAAPDSTAVILAMRGLELGAMPEATSYRHKDQVVEWTENGHATRVHTDCSGMANAIYKRVCEIDDAALARWLGRARPVARDYYDTISAERGFTRVNDILAIRPGDLIAIKFEPGAKDTGHVMFADSGALKRLPTPPEIDGTTQWDLTVIDCAASPHGTKDSRHKEGEPNRSGVGRGTIRLYTSDEGAIVGYAWSTAHKSVYRAASVRPIIIGHMSVIEKKPWESDAPKAPEDTRGDGSGEDPDAK